MSVIYTDEDISNYEEFYRNKIKEKDHKNSLVKFYVPEAQLNEQSGYVWTYESDMCLRFPDCMYMYTGVMVTPVQRISILELEKENVINIDGFEPGLYVAASSLFTPLLFKTENLKLPNNVNTKLVSSTNNNVTEEQPADGRFFVANTEEDVKVAVRAFAAINTRADGFKGEGFFCLYDVNGNLPYAVNGVGVFTWCIPLREVFKFINNQKSLIHCANEIIIEEMQKHAGFEMIGTKEMILDKIHDTEEFRKGCDHVMSDPAFRLRTMNTELQMLRDGNPYITILDMWSTEENGILKMIFKYKLIDASYDKRVESFLETVHSLISSYGKKSQEEIDGK